MKVNEKCSSLYEMKELVRILKPNKVDFNCSNCGKGISITNYVCFLRRKDLLCHSCKMKIINNKEDCKRKKGISKTKKNCELRKTAERQKIVENKEFIPRNLSIIQTFIDSDNELNYKFKCNVCGYEGVWGERAAHLSINGITGHPFCKNCYKQCRSGPENEIIEFIKTFYKDTILKNCRNVIKPKELDIYLPKLKIAIEYNGLYWHRGENFCLLEKKIICQKNNIKLIHIFEDEWLFHKEKIKKIIKDTVLFGFTNIEEVSFIKENILYVDLRFPFLMPNYKFLGNTNPKKLYFFDKQFINEVNDKNDYVYNCGYACFSLDGNTHKIDNIDYSFLKKEEIEIQVFNRNDVLSLQPFQKIMFICPECNKEKHYLAKTIQNKDSFICGNCSQKLHYPRK